MLRNLTLIFAISAAGCNQSGQPNAAKEPREDHTPEAQKSGPSVDVHRPIPVDETVKQPVASVSLLIDAPRALKIAELFVHENGYTDYVPPDADKLVPESIERSKRDDWIAERHHSVRPRALGYLHGSRNDPDGWTVGFDHFTPSDRGTGRAVTMNASGGAIRMEHQNLLLKSLVPRSD